MNCAWNPLTTEDCAGKSVGYTKFLTTNLQNVYLKSVLLWTGVIPLEMLLIYLSSKKSIISSKEPFPSTLIEWHKLDLSSCKSENVASVKKMLLQFICPIVNSICNYFDTKGIQLYTRFWLGLSHLSEHKFRHNFQDAGNPIGYCGEDIKTSCHYLLHRSFLLQWKTDLNVINGIDTSILGRRTVLKQPKCSVIEKAP